MDLDPYPVNNRFQSENSASFIPAVAQAFGDISEETGVEGNRIDFGTVTKALISQNLGEIILNPHPDAKKPGTDQQEEPEAIRSEILTGERYEDLATFLGSPKGIKRKLQVVVNRIYNPHKVEKNPKDEFHDFVIMVEEIADGRHRAAVFEYPKDHWPITLNGFRTHYLRLRMAAVLGGEEDSEVIFDSTGKDYEVGLLPHSEPNLESDIYATPSRILLRDIQRGIALVDKEEMPLTFSDLWTALGYLNLEGRPKFQEQFPASVDITEFLDENRGPTKEFFSQQPGLARLFGILIETMYAGNISIEDTEKLVQSKIPNLPELKAAVFKE